MKHCKSIRSVFISLIFALAVFGCARSPESAVLGKWQEQGGTEVLEFFKDGVVNIAKGKNSVAGKWSSLEDGRIKIEVRAFGTDHFMTAKADGNTLVMSWGGKTAGYQRIH